MHGSSLWLSTKTGQLNSSSAALLVYRINPHAREGDDPFAVCYAPAQEHNIGLLKTTVLRTKQREGKITLDVDANPAPVVLGGELGGDNSWEWERDVWTTMSGTEHETPPAINRGGPDIVQWAIGENKFAKKIIDRCDVAILLRRPKDGPFIVEFSGVKASVDWQYSFAETANKAGEVWEDLVGDETVSTKKHTYDVTEHGVCPEGVGPTALHELEVGTKLEKYAFMHILGEVRGIKE